MLWAIVFNKAKITKYDSSNSTHLNYEVCPSSTWIESSISNQEILVDTIKESSFSEFIILIQAISQQQIHHQNVL